MSADPSARPSGPTFSSTYHGHEPEYLRSLIAFMRAAGRPIVWLVGDSTLDNKYWFDDTARACNGLEEWLSGSKRVKQDVAYHMNSLLAQSQLEPIPFCINAAVEESTVGIREDEGLLPQDLLVVEHLQPDDVLIVSVGGNDIALRPSAGTAFWMAVVSRLAPSASCAPLFHFRSLFGKRVTQLVEKLTVEAKPRLVVVCGLYFPHERQEECWASRTLSIIGYDKNPKHLQDIMRRIYAEGTARVQVDGVRVQPLALFDVLDSSAESDDYAARVEPSAQGGAKMAAAFMDVLMGNDPPEPDERHERDA